jgi:hypothetical protein
MANRPNGVSIAGMTTLPPFASTAATASSVELTAKQVSQPFGNFGSDPPRPPSGFPPVLKVA